MQALTYRARETSDGALELTTPIRVRRGGGDLPWQDGIALWDTGASDTCITPAMAERLGLAKAERVKNRDTGEEVQTYRDLAIELHTSTGRFPVTLNRVHENRLTGIDVIVGMDIIGCGDFAVTRVGGEVWFTFRCPPRGKHIDFAGTGAKDPPP